jgi:hypothetical protein
MKPNTPLYELYTDLGHHVLGIWRVGPHEKVKLHPKISFFRSSTIVLGLDEPNSAKDKHPKISSFRSSASHIALNLQRVPHVRVFQ